MQKYQNFSWSTYKNGGASASGAPAPFYKKKNKKGVIKKLVSGVDAPLYAAQIKNIQRSPRSGLHQIDGRIKMAQFYAANLLKKETRAIPQYKRNSNRKIIFNFNIAAQRLSKKLYVCSFDLFYYGDKKNQKIQNFKKRASWRVAWYDARAVRSELYKHKAPIDYTNIKIPGLKKKMISRRLTAFQEVEGVPTYWPSIKKFPYKIFKLFSYPDTERSQYKRSGRHLLVSLGFYNIRNRGGETKWGEITLSKSNIYAPCVFFSGAKISESIVSIIERSFANSICSKAVSKQQIRKFIFLLLQDGRFAYFYRSDRVFNTNKHRNLYEANNINAKIRESTRLLPNISIQNYLIKNFIKKRKHMPYSIFINYLNMHFNFSQFFFGLKICKIFCRNMQPNIGFERILKHLLSGDNGVGINADPAICHLEKITKNNFILPFIKEKQDTFNKTALNYKIFCMSKYKNYCLQQIHGHNFINIEQKTCHLWLSANNKALSRVEIIHLIWRSDIPRTPFWGLYKSLVSSLAAPLILAQTSFALRGLVKHIYILNCLYIKTRKVFEWLLKKKEKPLLFVSNSSYLKNDKPWKNSPKSKGVGFMPTPLPRGPRLCRGPLGLANCRKNIYYWRTWRDAKHPANQFYYYGCNNKTWYGGATHPHNQCGPVLRAHTWSLYPQFYRKTYKPMLALGYVGFSVFPKSVPSLALGAGAGSLCFFAFEATNERLAIRANLLDLLKIEMDNITIIPILWQLNKKNQNQNSLYSIFKKYWLKITLSYFYTIYKKTQVQHKKLLKKQFQKRILYQWFLFQRNLNTTLFFKNSFIIGAFLKEVGCIKINGSAYTISIKRKKYTSAKRVSYALYNYFITEHCWMEACNYRPPALIELKEFQSSWNTDKNPFFYNKIKNVAYIKKNLNTLKNKEQNIYTNNLFVLYTYYFSVCMGVRRTPITSVGPGPTLGRVDGVTKRRPL
jgi:hypothetical protein